MFKLDELFGVAGKVVVITGGGTGLGRSMAAGFAENGAKVYITGRRMDVLEKTAQELTSSAGKGGSVIPVQGDVATKEGCVKIADAVKAKEGKVDVLINCAGVGAGYRSEAHPNDPDAIAKQLAAVEDEDLSFTNAVNVNGVLFMTAQFVPLLRKADDPSVIVIASIAGLALQRATGSIMYGVSKSATIHLGKMLAARLTPLKIRVNTICPGIFATEMTGAVAGASMNEMSQKAGLRAPLGRGGDPHEIVGPAIMLASRGGGYMHGAVFTVDGGRVMVAGGNDGIEMPSETNTYGVFEA